MRKKQLRVSRLSLKTSFNDIKRSHWEQMVSMVEIKYSKTILVSAVRVEPVAAATSFAWKGSMVKGEVGAVVRSDFVIFHLIR